MSRQAFKYDRKKRYDKYDYVFETLKNYLSVAPYLTKRLDGESWQVAIVDFPMKELRELLKEKDRDHVIVDIFVKQELMEILVQENPELQKREVSKWDLFREYLDSLSLILDGKAERELYNRTGGDIEKASVIISELTKFEIKERLITVKHLNMVSVENKNVYARDVLITALVLNNELVPRKGHPLARYKYKNVLDLYEDLIATLGEKYAFRALKKSATKLLEGKIKYLDGSLPLTDKSLPLYEVIDVYEVLHAKVLLSQSNELQARICLLQILNRRVSKNVDVF